jgi:peptide/nickel transport system ATP-binding protein
MTAQFTQPPATAAQAALTLDNVSVEFALGRSAGKVQAVSSVSMEILHGETLGLVGESGCGKSSLAKAIMQLPRPARGRVVFDGVDLASLSGAELRRTRPHIQMVFQDPISSLNPRRTIASIVAEPAIVWRRASGAGLRHLVDETLVSVGLDPAAVRDRRPTQFSGGQCQRVCIARALILDPEVIVCDEPVSALDVSVQAQILNLLEDLRVSRRLTLLFISHDLAVVKNVSDRVGVMYLGKLCEIADSDTLYREPAHPYTAALLAAIPSAESHHRGLRPRLVGELPSPSNPPSGCRFRTRCPRAQARCAEVEPVMREFNPGQFAACHFPLIDSGRRKEAASNGDA